MNDTNPHKSYLEHNIFTIHGDLDGGDDTHIYSNIRQYIGFLIGQEEFLLPVDVMNEIIMVTDITFVPGAPRFIEGVINLRGNIIPAINIRQMMSLSNISSSPHNRIIIAHHGQTAVGLLVDGITYVIPLHPEQIEDHTPTAPGVGCELMSGISKRNSKINGIIDIAKVIAETGVNMSQKDSTAKASAV